MGRTCYKFTCLEIEGFNEQHYKSLNESEKWTYLENLFANGTKVVKHTEKKCDFDGNLPIGEIFDQWCNKYFSGEDKDKKNEYFPQDGLSCPIAVRYEKISQQKYRFVMIQLSDNYTDIL